MSEIYVVTSGKGGVGKTTTTANIGVGFAMRGKSVVLIDTDTGLRNLDLLLGLENRIMYDLVDVTSGHVPYKKALVRHKKYDSLYLLPTSQVKDKSAVNPDELAALCEELRRSYDIIIIDCPAGIEQGFKTAIAAADTAIVVTMPEISAVRDADKIIGELGRADKEDICLVVNRILREVDAQVTNLVPHIGILICHEIALDLRHTANDIAVLRNDAADQLDLPAQEGTGTE